jgi:cyclopropane fatty-acyl-phospholipid synthase-like methyltransferase
MWQWAQVQEVLRRLTPLVTMHKPFSESCVENRAPISAVLGPRLASQRSLLEIGSGTGQHAVYFAADLPHLRWQTSDRVENHGGIRAWLDEAGLPNVAPPLALDVLSDPWPAGPYDAAFSANTAHIMSEAAVAAMFEGMGRVLSPDAPFLLYGPFNYDGRFTSPSNRDFDAWLRHRDPQMGVRDVAWLRELAGAAGLVLDEDVEMPVNNRCLVWRRQAR